MRRTLSPFALAFLLVALMSVVAAAQTTGAGSPGATGQSATPNTTQTQPYGGNTTQSSPPSGAETGQAGAPGSMTGSGSNSPALERSYTGTSGMQSEAYRNDDRDGFNFGWLGLLGLAGLLGLRQSRRDHVTTTTPR